MVKSPRPTQTYRSGIEEAIVVACRGGLPWWLDGLEAVMV